MSREILIVGSGFMGTSMAHALKNCDISCLETHQAYLTTLRNLNIYKKVFLEEAEKADLKYLKGHRTVGGMRASIYNSMKIESVSVLKDFMENFEKNYG